MFPRPVWTEILLRIGLLAIHLLTEQMSPYIRVVQPEEHWHYKYPSASSSIVSSQSLSVSYIVSHVLNPVIMIFCCVSVILIAYGINKDIKPALIALLVPTMALPLTGIVTNIIKVTIGNLRPDYFARCFGENYLHVSIADLAKAQCTGDKGRVLGGRKSFPSGHSALSFCALGFVSIYLASQLRTFSSRDSRPSFSGSWRLLLPLVPLLGAALVALSRVCDYHHHWQDVIAGSILGFSIMYSVYRQYFPELSSPRCDKPYPFFGNSDTSGTSGLELVSTNSPSSSTS